MLVGRRLIAAALLVAGLASACQEQRSEAYRAGAQAGSYWYGRGYTALQTELECHTIGGWDGQDKLDYTQGCKDGWQEAYERSSG